MPRPNQQDRLCDIIGDILSLSPDCHRQPPTMKNLIDKPSNTSGLMTFPQIWVESVCDESSDEDDDKNFSRHNDVEASRCMSFSSTDVSFESASLSPSSTRQNSLQFASRENSVECSSGIDEEVETTFTEEVSNWLAKINARGFSIDLMRQHVTPDKCEEENDAEEEEEAEDDETWWEDGVVRVFDPYFEVALDDISVVEGKKNSEGKPIGQCNVILKNGDSVFGIFRQGIRQGRGALEGSNCFDHGLVGLRGFYKDGVLTGEGRAILVTGAWVGVNRLTLEGVFSNGYLEGPVRGIDDKGNLMFIGSFKEGIASGPCWLAREGQGWIHGVVDEKGRFSGDDLIFLHPDFHTCLVGTFKNERLVSAKASKVAAISFNENGVLVLSPGKQFIINFIN
jgi:hypothetical protein